jgi:hydrogenase/urease accessory protein HupE
MYAHLEAHVGGWWGGVLHPVRTPVDLVMMLLVGLVGGLGVRTARAAWSAPATFVTSSLAFGLIAAVTQRGVDLDVVLVAMLGVLGALVLTPPRLTRIAAPAIVSICGAVHGLVHATSPSGRVRPGAYVIGFAFTSCLLLTVGSIVGAATGRSMVARTRRREPVPVRPAEERALV